MRTITTCATMSFQFFPPPFKRGIRPLIFTLACSVHAPTLAQAQQTGDLAISRTCLWNADRATWSDLHAKRKQVARLERIRQRYPAVVDGQWLFHEEDAPIEPAGSPPATNPTAPAGLQAELREVLSAKQLARWHKLCNPPEVTSR